MTLEEMIALIDALLSNPDATPEEMAQLVQQIREGLATMVAEGADGESLDAEQLSAIADGVTKIEEKMNKAIANRNKVKSFLNDNARKVAADTKANNIGGASMPATNTVVNATPKRVKSRHYASNEDAYFVGQFLRAMNRKGNPAAESWLRDRGFEMKALTSADNASAGILVPEQMDDAILKLRNQYGVAMQLGAVVSGTSETYRRRKIVSGNTAYAVVEGSAITRTQPSYQHIQLTAKLFGARTEYYTTFSEDAIINVVDELTEEHARAHAVLMDDAYFIGDGTQVYSGVIGATYAFRKVLEDAGGTWTNDTHKGYLGGAVVASGATWASVTDDDISKLVGSVENYPGANPVFTTTSQFYWNVMHPLAMSAGGTTATEVVNGVPRPVFYGYPVVFNNSMAKYSEADSVPLLFGDFAQGSIILDRRGATIETDKNISTQLEEVVSTMRWDVLVHDIGNYNATATSRKGGAISALIIQNS